MTAISKKFFVACFLIGSVFAVPTASASTLYNDGFEDGDYTNNPSWSTYSCSSVQVTNNGFLTGTYELETSCEPGSSAGFGLDTGDLTNPVFEFDFRIPSFESGQDVYFSAYSDAGISGVRPIIVRESSGDLNALGSSGSTTLVSGLSTDTNYNVKINDTDFSAETYDVWVDGVKQVDDTGFFESANHVASISPNIGGGAGPAYYDNLQVCDSGSCTSGNSPPSISSFEPLDGSSQVSTSPLLNVTVSDLDEDSMDVSFYDASDDSQIGSTQTGISSGGTASVTWNGLSKDTTYNWYANVTDGQTTSQSSTYSFTTVIEGQVANISGSTVFQDGFEDGTLNKWSGTCTGSTTASNLGKIDGSYELEVIDCSPDEFGTDFNALTDPVIKFKFRIDSFSSGNDIYFSAFDGDFSTANNDNRVSIVRESDGDLNVLGADTTETVVSGLNSGQVYSVTLKDFDFGAETYNVYVDGSLKISGKEFWKTGLNDVETIIPAGDEGYYDSFQVCSNGECDSPTESLSISFENQTTFAGSYSDLTSITGNISATNSNRIDLTLYNTSGLVSSVSESSSNFNYNEFTGLSTGTYYLNASAFNSTSSVSTSTREIILADYTARPDPSQVANISVANQARRVIWNNDSSMFAIATKNGVDNVNEGIIYKRGQYSSPFQSFDLNGTMMLDAAWREHRDLIAFFTDQTTKNIQIYDTSDWSFVTSLENDKAHSGVWHPSEEKIIAEDLDDPNNNATLAFYDVTGSDSSSWSKVRQTGRYGTDMFKMDVCGDRLVFAATDKDASPETNVAYVWNISGSDVSQYSEIGSISGVAKPQFSPSCDYFVVQNHDNQQVGEVYRTDSQVLYESFTVPGTDRTSFKFSPNMTQDNSNLLSGKIGFGNPDNFGYIDVSNFSTESFSHPLSGSSTWAKEVSWRPDGQVLATTQTTADTVFLWNVSNSYTGTDTSKPSITLDSPLNQTYSSSSVDLNVTSSEAANYTWNVDGGTNSTINEDDQDLNTTLTGLSDGGHTVNVYGTDSAGNTGFASQAFTVDTTSPEASILSPENITYQETSSVDLNVTRSDATSGVQTDEYNLDNSGYSSFTPNTTITGLNEGTHNLKYRVTDNAGNEVVKEVDFSINITQKYFVKSVPAGKSVAPRSNPISDLTLWSNSVTEGETSVLFGNSLGSDYAAELRINFQENVSAGNLVVDTNRTSRKTVLHNTASINNVVEKSLLIPRENQSGKVKICSDATSLSEVGFDCSNGYNISTGESVNGVTLSEVSINNEDYYKAEGVSGTGGFEYEIVESSDTSSSSGGGGSSPSTSVDANISFSRTNFVFEEGETVERDIIVESDGSTTVPVSLSVGSTGVCSPFSFETDSGYSKSTSFEVTDEERVGVKVEMPSNSELQEFEEWVCLPDVSTGASHEDLRLTISKDKDFFYLVEDITGVDLRPLVEPQEISSLCGLRDGEVSDCEPVSASPLAVFAGLALLLGGVLLYLRQ